MIKKSMKKLSVGLALISTLGHCMLSALSEAQALTSSKGFLQPRASSANIDREMLMQPSTENRNPDGWYGEISASTFYQRYWNDSDDGSGLGTLPLWSGTNVMSVGSNTASSTTMPISGANVDAYQLGLGPVAPGVSPATMTLNPKVYQAGLDFMLIFGSSAHESGFFAKAKVPLAVYNIDYQLTEYNPLTAVNYPAGALSISSSTVTDPATTITQAFSGFTSQTLTNGDYSPMVFGLIDTVPATVIRFADVEVTMGYNFISNHDNSFTIAARFSAPTGNKATGEFMLEPIVGRGGNYGFGGYAASQIRLWEDNDDNCLTFKFMSELTHLFTTNTMRSYDLKSAGPGSRYLLVANYLDNAYQSEIQNLINYTTLMSNSSFGVEADIAVAINYMHHGWSFDLGYDFYGRSAELLAINGDFSDQTYAILGRQGVGTISSGLTPSTLCQPTATIGSSVDRTDTAGGAVVSALVATNRISIADLNVQAAAQAAYMTSKLFTKVAYEWSDIDYIPFFGAMAEFEMSNSSNNALPQWSLAILGGMSF